MKIMITESKKEKLADCAEKVLHYAGKLMQCIESLEGGEFGERGGYGERGGGYGERDGYGERMGMRGQMDASDYKEKYDMSEGRYGMRRY